MPEPQTKLRLLIIDPQRDFCDGPCAGSLPVPGADADMVRLAALVDRLAGRIDGIQVTLDSHQLYHVANPVWWVGEDGNPPAPFTLISVADVESGRWRARNPEAQEHARVYVGELARKGNYPLTIWPPHCLIGTPGHAVHPELMAALLRWAGRAASPISFVTKGGSPGTEHYSAFRAEVEDPHDPATQANPEMLRFIEDADLVAIAGEAKSHCVRATVTDLADALAPEHLRKLLFLDDCSSPVPAFPGGPDFPALGAQFVRDLAARGMQVINSPELMV
jgi:nicotinamidase-related amidase